MSTKPGEDQFKDPSLVDRMGRAGVGAASKVYISVGGGETPTMVAGERALAHILKASRTLTVRDHVYEGERHLTYYPALVGDALRWMFPSRTALGGVTKPTSLYAGHYALENGGQVLVVSRADQLFVTLEGDEQRELFSTGPGKFLVKGTTATIVFARDREGRADTILLQQGGARVPGRRTQP